MRQSFYNQSLQDLTEQVMRSGIAPVHAAALYKAAYRDLSDTPWLQPKVPQKLGEQGSEWWHTQTFKTVVPHTSKYDGTTKFLLTLHDERQIEMVLIPEKSRLTLCISSQVGCRQACTFCHTGRMGLMRDLSAGEIVAQVVYANKWITDHPDWLVRIGAAPDQRVTNIVFMGMGEPLDNVQSLIKALQILTSPVGLGIAQRRISVSTAGHLEGLETLQQIFPRIPIAVSLHQATNRLRSQIMPINRRWPLPMVIEAIKRINATTGNHVLIQYTVIQGVNDHEQDAEALIALLRDLKIKINLIPLNEIEPSKFGSPTPERLQSFRNRLHQAGLRVMVRYSKGQDIAAACGQLVSY